MKTVRIYSLSTCLWCRKTKKWFEEKGVAFEAVDYDKLDDSGKETLMKEIKSCGGTGSFPFVKIDNSCVQGYDPDEFEKKLAK